MPTAAGRRRSDGRRSADTGARPYGPTSRAGGAVLVGRERARRRPVPCSPAGALSTVPLRSGADRSLLPRPARGDGHPRPRAPGARLQIGMTACLPQCRVGSRAQPRASVRRRIRSRARTDGESRAKVRPRSRRPLSEGAHREAICAPEFGGALRIAARSARAHGSAPRGEDQRPEDPTPGAQREPAAGRRLRLTATSRSGTRGRSGASTAGRGAGPTR
jgi:hypothetical protein